MLPHPIKGTLPVCGIRFLLLWEHGGATKFALTLQIFGIRVRGVLFDTRLLKRVLKKPLIVAAAIVSRHIR